jgi:hypothetical protein
MQTTGACQVGSELSRSQALSTVVHASGCAPLLLYVLLYKADDVPRPRQNLYGISPQVAGTRRQAPSPWPAATELPARLSTFECARSAAGPNLKPPHSPQPR